MGLKWAVFSRLAWAQFKGTTYGKKRGILKHSQQMEKEEKIDTMAWGGKPSLP
jgi:hypothetical protein